MIRATTPTHALKFDDGILDEAVQIIVTYKQDRVKRDITWAGYDTNVIERDADNNQLLIRWTQEESSKFRADRDVGVQVRIYNQNSEVGATHIIPQNVFKVLNDQIMGGESVSTEDYEWIYDEPNLPEAELRKYYSNIADYYNDVAKLYAKVGLPAPIGADAQSWDYELARDEAESLANKLGLENTPSWDVEVSSSEAARLRRQLNIIGI